jgi:membrane protease YdiL (CAAX protease family)
MQTGGRRIAAALAIVAIWVAITVDFGRGWSGPKRPLDEAINSGFDWNIFLAGLFLAAALLVFRWRDVGLAAPRAHTLRLLWLPCLFIVGFFAGAVLIGMPPLPVVGLILVNAAMVGWSEEMAFRGVLFSALRTGMNIWPAMILATVLFGSVHILNGFGTGQWTGAFIQAVAAAMSGLLFMAILIRTGSIIPAMVVHALWDAGLFMMSYGARDPVAANTPPESAGWGALLPLLFVLPNFVYALWLLRKVRGTSTGMPATAAS